jgi:ribosomal protein S18 acetylase RimI-like enzyme
MEKPKVEKVESEQQIFIVDEFQEKYLDDVLALEKECFPVEMQYSLDEGMDYYRKVLSDKKNVNIFLIENGKAVGYCLGIPLESYFNELKELDPEIELRSGVIYLDTIQISPKFQGRGGAKKLLLSLCDESQKKGIVDFSTHARKANGFNLMVKKVFDDGIVASREIEKWRPAQGEPYEYIEWKIK